MAYPNQNNLGPCLGQAHYPITIIKIKVISIYRENKFATRSTDFQRVSAAPKCLVLQGPEGQTLKHLNFLEIVFKMELF